MKVAYKIILLFISITLVSGCQNTGSRSDNTNYTVAVNTKSSFQPVKYVPVPMPGQLMSLKKGQGKKHLVGEAAIEEANQKATKQPTSGEYINSIMTFDYMPGALYQIYAAPLSVTDIQFQENEHIVAVGAGDTTRWHVSKTYSGIGASRQEHLLIKPIEDGITNGVVVTTDMRTYHLMLIATPKTYMASVTWRYPEGDNLVRTFEDSPDSGPMDIMNGVDIDRLNFNYEIKMLKKRASKPDWFPRMVFNDGNKTYIKFLSTAEEAPTLFIGDTKNSQIANYRVQGNYYIVDSIFYQAQLRGGINNNVVVQITLKK